MQPNKLNKPSDELIKSAKRVLEAMAYTKKIRPIIEGIKEKVLLEKAYLNPVDSTLIIEISDSWLMSEADMENYTKLLDVLYMEAGFYVGKGECPLLIAENLERNAKYDMIDLSQELHQIFDIKKVYFNAATLKAYVDITLNYLIQFI